MEIHALDQFLAAELENERCKSIPAIAKNDGKSEVSLEQWFIMGLLPSRLERVQLATSLVVDRTPGGSWALCSLLLKDSEQDVVGNAINSMTRSKLRSFAHRAFHYFKSPERPQRILYCLARYCEEADDRRIAEQLAPTLASDLSDAYLARSFNALYKHGIRSDAALKVAMELVESHIDATNMDRKAAVAAITYLFFAGNKKHIASLKKIHESVTIPELRRLLNWGFKEIALIFDSANLDLNFASPVTFWERNLDSFNSNFTGYGCFSPHELIGGLVDLEKRNKLPQNPQLTERILSLGNPECSDWLAANPKYGIAQLRTDSPDTLLAWKKHATQNASSFLESALNSENADLWHNESPELIALLVKSETLANCSQYSEKWLQSARKSHPDTALNILLGSLLAIENIVLNSSQSEQQFSETICKICREIDSLINNSNAHSDAFIEKILGTLIGSPLENQILRNLAESCIQKIGWWDIAQAFVNRESSAHIHSLIKRFEQLAQSDHHTSLNDEQILRFTRTVSLTVLNSNPEHFNGECLTAIKKTAKIIELLDPNKNVSALSTEGDDDLTELDESDPRAADWSGHAVVDRPIGRWGTILSVLSSHTNEQTRTNLPDSESEAQLLIEALRTALHVEKRWIVRALAAIGTDQAVKAILYQGLQHIDSEFVALCIRELLPSSHPRAQQALIRCVGRNAISDDLKLNILDEISMHNPEEILQELRTLEILRLPQHIDDAVRDAVGRVAALIDVSQKIQTETNQGKVIRLDGQDIDSVIRGFLPNHELLNVDSRSALRTAEMILIQSRGWTQGGMDLSPIVNMHCKAVELVLRDSFEPFTDALLRKGQLSRKLDILGYARPIPEKMQIFEDTLANLPVIKSIPYFSKFKLRKMLRGICLYRPGKRFTLDGPKAFALFFLVVSRQSCPFGLEKILSLGFKTDVDLFEYIKLIHSLQDSRNRAVHEGLTWDAKDEIESMRAQAFKIIDISLKIKKHLSSNDSANTANNSLGLGA